MNMTVVCLSLDPGTPQQAVKYTSVLPAETFVESQCMSRMSLSPLIALQGGGTRSELPPSEEMSAPLVSTVSTHSAVQYGPVAQSTSMPVHASMDQAASFLPFPVTPALERMLQVGLPEFSCANMCLLDIDWFSLASWHVCRMFLVVFLTLFYLLQY